MVIGTSGLATVARRLGSAARRDQPLGALTTYRVGGTAALLVEAASEQDLRRVGRALAGTGVPVLVLGRGSNLLVADAGFPGLVVRPAGELAALGLPPAPADSPGKAAAGPAVVRAGSAVALPTLARRTVEAGWSGLEWAVGVPGSVGGGLRMNAGGHGSDIASSLQRYRLVDLDGGEVVEGPASDLALGYRSSSVGPAQAVVWAELGVRPGDAERGRQVLGEIVRWRREHQPGGSNAGSVFVNPDPDEAGGRSAGALVEEAGLKGHRLGTACVSPKHANFIQADPGGSADDVYRLMEHVRARIAEHFGIVLRSEVRLVGFEGAGAGEEGSR